MEVLAQVVVTTLHRLRIQQADLSAFTLSPGSGLSVVSELEGPQPSTSPPVWLQASHGGQFYLDRSRRAISFLQATKEIEGLVKQEERGTFPSQHVCVGGWGG